MEESGINKIESLVLMWAEDKDIFNKSNVFAQTEKFKEEVEELVEAIESDWSQERKLELGDCLVVLTLIANFLGSSLEECYQLAYDKISKRTGKMIDGVFVKDE